MRLYVEKDYEAMSRRAADVIGSLIIQKPDCVLGLATGTTPIGTYQNLVAECKSGKLDFSKVRTVNLDEYRNLPFDNDQSYHYFMNDNLFAHVNIDPANTNVPDGLAEDGAAAGKAYDALIDSFGGTDLQLLGLGQNGHIGFNEPDDRFIPETHVVTLTQNTIEANSRLFNDISEVPTQALTMGMWGIMTSKCVLLIANGPKKAEALKKALYGPITPEVPASILQVHPNLIVVCDEEAYAAVKG